MNTESLMEMSDAELDTYIASLNEEQLDEILGFYKKVYGGAAKLAMKGAKGAGKLAVKGAKAGIKKGIEKGKEKFTDKGKLAAAEKKGKELENKRKIRDKIEAAREKIKAEKAALKKKKEDMPPNTFKKMRMALAKKVSKVNDAEDNLKESYTPIMEGVNDPSIFKAVFLAGGPGSGKSFVVGQTALKALGFRLINSDNAFEKGLKKAGLTTDPEDIASAQGQSVRASAKALTGKIMARALEGRMGIVVDGTGKNYSKIKSQVDMLRALGYSVHMIFVNTDLETAQARNNSRPRSLPDDMVAGMWKDVQTNIGKFQALFRQRMTIVDNSQGSNIEKATMDAFKKIKTWAAKAPENSIAIKWIKGQKK